MLLILISNAGEIFLSGITSLGVAYDTVGGLLVDQSSLALRYRDRYVPAEKRRVGKVRLANPKVSVQLTNAPTSNSCTLSHPLHGVF